MAVEKVSRESAEDPKASNDQVVLDTLESERQAPQPLSRKQTLSAYFTIAAAAFGLIRCVLS
jgi:hypothetical protein